MELPQRKPNRIKTYDYSSGGAYFITVCVKGKHKMLGKIVGDDAYIVPPIGNTAPHLNNRQYINAYTELSEYGIVCEKYIHGITGIDKYVIMPDHIHMIIIIDDFENGTMWASSPTQSIPQLIKSFKTLVAKDIGFSMFQRSFYDHIIRSDSEYLEICQYIITNPLKWQLEEHSE